MPEIKLPNNNNVDENAFTDKKETKPKNKKNTGIVSAYDENGNSTKRSEEAPKLSKRFKVFIVFVYIFGFFAALGVIFLMSQCSK